MMKYYNVTVKYGRVIQDKRGGTKINFIKQQYLVNSSSISNAQATIKGVLSGIYDIYEIVSIKQSPICGIINQIQNTLGD